MATVYLAHDVKHDRDVALKVLKESATGSTWSPGLGWGRLDAAAAVQLALATRGAALRTAVAAH